MTAPAHDQRDQRDLEKLLEFIEGNQSGKKNNNKKAEKKARQKQRRVFFFVNINLYCILYLL